MRLFIYGNIHKVRKASTGIHSNCLIQAADTWPAMNSERWKWGRWQCICYIAIHTSIEGEGGQQLLAWFLIGEVYSQLCRPTNPKHIGHASAGSVVLRVGVASWRSWRLLWQSHTMTSNRPTKESSEKCKEHTQRPVSLRIASAFIQVCFLSMQDGKLWNDTDGEARFLVPFKHPGKAQRLRPDMEAEKREAFTTNQSACASTLPWCT